MIRLHDVHKVFHAGRPNEWQALRGVTVSLEKGRLTVFRGPSGSGKTTLLSLVGCMARPSAGRIFVGEQEVTSLPERFLTEVRRHTFGFVFQSFHLVRGLTALENVMLPAYPRGLPHPTLKKQALGLLARFGLEGRASSPVDGLSGGESQRVAIARALVNDPSVVVADEPTAHLDGRLSGEFLGFVAELRAEGRTVLIASHDPAVWNSPLVDRTVTLQDGRLAAGDDGCS